VTGLDAITKILFCPTGLASGGLSVRIFIVLFSSVRRSIFHKTRNFLSTAVGWLNS
jgi:hypothetical protein